MTQTKGGVSLRCSPRQSVSLVLPLRRANCLLCTVGTGRPECCHSNGTVPVFCRSCSCLDFSPENYPQTQLSCILFVCRCLYVRRLIHNFLKVCSKETCNHISSVRSSLRCGSEKAHNGAPVSRHEKKVPERTSVPLPF